MASSSLPFFVNGTVIKGFGRGSKALGTPTANFDQSVIQLLPPTLSTGIYFGWAQLNGPGPKVPVYQMVTSIGFNPYFKNQTKSMETHLIHTFSDDFYGTELRICLAGYLRDEKNFTSLDALKEAIQNDITMAKEFLIKPEFQRLSQHAFFTAEPAGATSPPNPNPINTAIPSNKKK
jgi:riboflavin kinase